MVEIVTQKPILKISLPTWRWPLWAALALFLVSLGGFVFLRFYLFQIQADIVNNNNLIKNEAAKISSDDAQTISQVSDLLAVFRSLLNNHSYMSLALGSIASLTHPQVAFSQANINAETQAVQLRGAAQSYSVLAKQIVAFRENKNIKGVEVKGINFVTTGLNFELSLNVDPKMFLAP